jgi:hypothetical protein
MLISLAFSGVPFRTPIASRYFDRHFPLPTRCGFNGHQKLDFAAHSF